MKPEKMLEVCPVCGSADLYYEAGGYTGKIYRCKNCDYMGALILTSPSLRQMKQENEANVIVFPSQRKVPIRHH